MSEDQAVEFASDIGKAVVDGFEGMRDVLGILVSFDFLRNVKAVFQQARANRLGRRHYAIRPEELAIYALPALEEMVSFGTSVGEARDKF